MSKHSLFFEFYISLFQYSLSLPIFCCLFSLSLSQYRSLSQCHFRHFSFSMLFPIVSLFQCHFPPNSFCLPIIIPFFQIMVCTTDSASNNDTLMVTIEKTCQSQNIDFTKDNNHVWCLAYVINLAVQDALKVLKAENAAGEDVIFNENQDESEVIPKVGVWNYDLPFKFKLLTSFYAAS